MEWGQMARSCVRKREREMTSLSFSIQYPAQEVWPTSVPASPYTEKRFPLKPRVLVHVSDTRCVICKL
jgi:hypothetical protein